MTTPIDNRGADAPTLSAELVDDVLVVTIDKPGDSVNTLTTTLVTEFERVFQHVDQDPLIKAVLLISGKADSFIAGADIEQFTEFRAPADAERVSKLGQDLLNRLEKLRVPVVAAIHGACLGGGLEVALACTYRVATDHPKTVFALPEVQLGVIPGMGGTQRLPKRVGLQAALDMILAGRNVRAKRALQMGLVDEMVHPAILREIALDRAHSLASNKLTPDRGGSHGALSLVLEHNPIGRSVVFKKARESVMEKTHGHFPAPLAALEAVQAGYSRGMKEGLREEARLFGEMAITDVSRQLVFLFFASNALKKDKGVDEPAPPARDIHKLAILGAGFMGAGIASIAVQNGTLVRLKDTDPPRIGRGLASVRGVLQERLTRKQITRVQLDDFMSLVGGTSDYSGFRSADLVIEAVFEDLGLKHQVLAEVEPEIDPEVVYASNTSTIPIAKIAAGAKHAHRVLGMHFFSPVHRMPLLEVIVTPQTSPEATVTAVAYGKRLGKTVIVVNDGPGFYTTRTLSAYMNEAGRLLEEGASIESIDNALVEFGFPVGPITLLDEVGIDVGGKVGAVLADAFGARMAPADAMRRIVEAGRTGRKGGKGFYQYDEVGDKGRVDESVYEIIGGGRRDIPADEIVSRCVLAMVNEAVLCLQDGVLRSPRDGDIGAVFGIGFPPFRGGPFRYVDSVGADRVVQRLEELNARFEPRFAPAELLVDMARGRRTFYSTAR
ncbi:MAG TPA: fatty acid oxidation complex subunit alpha FadJ [Gemmatimonadaceae bacterium]|jgi:3-hydroxyacyl-CoA dehydrogenase/enoyl-CoA hydratase/3-hydroxybutyryl-CoA epimerase